MNPTSTFVYQGRHSGYRRLEDGVGHTRTFTLDRATSVLRFVDVLEGQGRHRLRWHFHCAPDVTAAVVAGALDATAGAVKVRLVFPAGLNVSVSDSWYSPSYGVKRGCVAIDLQAEVEIATRSEYAFELIAG